MKINRRKEKRNPRGGGNMVTPWAKLTKAERAVVIVALNNYGGFNYRVHMGLLPFIPLATALQAMRTLRKNDDTNRRMMTRIIHKMAGTTQAPVDHISFAVNLRHKRVVRRFGDWIKRGARIPFCQPFQTTAGLRWSLPHRAYIDDKEAKVFPMFTLNHVQTIDRDWSAYIVVCPKAHSDAMRIWLKAYC